MATAKQEFQLAGLANAWFDDPGRWHFDLKNALHELEDDEVPVAMFESILAGSIFQGLTLTTDRRVLFTRFRFWLWHWPVMRSFRYRDLLDVRVETNTELPAIVLDLIDGSTARLQSTKSHAARFDAIAEEIRRCASGAIP